MVPTNLQRGASVITLAAKEMPISAGVYCMIDDRNKALYIGKAKVLPKRVISYASTHKLPYRLKMMVSQVTKVDFLVTETEAQALLLEANLINSAQPPYNILLKDDKSFPYIMIENNHAFPRISKYRGSKKDDSNSYYGPFACVQAVNETIAEMQKMFKMRPCSNNYFNSRARPCLQFQLKRCSAPCVARISAEEYVLSVKQAKDFLSGKSNELKTTLKQQMHEASDKMDYEKAADIRDKIKVLSQIQARNITSTGNLTDADVFALYQDDGGNCCIQVFFIRNSKHFGNKPYYLQNTQEQGPDQIMEALIAQFYQVHTPPSVILVSHIPSEKNLLENALKAEHGKIKIISPHGSPQLQVLMEFAMDNAKEYLSGKQKEDDKNQINIAHLYKRFNLSKLPCHIEVYDNSHMQGDHAFGCYIVSKDGALNKKLYRTFRIKEQQGRTGDDFAMLAETLTRRFKRLVEGQRADLLVIDGGEGQLTYTLKTLDKLGWNDVDVICMAKGADRTSGREFFHMRGMAPFQLPVGDPALTYLHRLRNEAHRFAISTHRKSMLKSIDKSGVDAIPNIGKARKIALLTYFGSMDLLKKATFSDLERVPGISKKIAKTIVEYLHNVSNG